MAAIIKIDQAGLPAGVAGKSRSDGLATGALVTIASMGAGAVHALELLWVPDDDATVVASLVQTSPTTWTFAPQALRYGTYRLRLTVDGVSNVRTYSIRTPKRGLRIPALNEVASKLASLPQAALSAAALAALRQSSEFNEDTPGSVPFAAGNYGGWYSALRELFLAADNPGVFSGSAEFWVDPAGNDNNPGTALLPWLTYARAAAEVMKCTAFDANSSMIIHLVGPSGTLYNMALIHDVSFGVNSYLAIVGDTTDTVLGSTAMTAGSDVAVATGAGCTEAQVVVAGAGWAVDAYVGKTLRVTSGASAGVRATIASNTATMLRITDNTFLLTTGGLTFAPGDTFVIESQGIALATNELITFSDLPGLSGRGGVLLCNLRIEGTINGTNAAMQFLGCQNNGTRSCTGSVARMLIGGALQTSTEPNPTTIYAALGMPTVAGSSFHWYAWGGRGAADDRASQGGQYAGFGAVQYGLYPATNGSMLVGGARILGACLAQGDGAILYLVGGGGQVRVESAGEGAYGGCIQAAQGGKLQINRAAFACAGRCIVLGQGAKALIGTSASVLVTGAPTTGRAALSLFGSNNAALFRVAMQITGNGVGFDWEIDGATGVAADVTWGGGGGISDAFGNRIGRIGL